MKLFKILFLSFVLTTLPEVIINNLNNNELEVVFDLNLPEKIVAVKESINLNSSSPDFKVKVFEILSESKKDYDSILKDINSIEKNIKARAVIIGNLNKNFELHVSYQDKNTKKFFDEVIPVVVKTGGSLQYTRTLGIQSVRTEEKAAQGTSLDTARQIEGENRAVRVDGAQRLETYERKAQQENSISIFTKISIFIENLVTKSNSLWVQLIAVFLLGILMSLTPCIYPMIPITAGILQSYGSKSFLHNFIASSLYALGIATTFSVFGLISASTGQLLGNLLTNPFFIVFMILLLGYMGLTMLGVVDFYAPKFMQNNNLHVKKMGIFSAYIFGIISGSVASPCLTPGLALLLTLVATLANKFLGFLFLFIAGIGLSIPMLLIGTFSSSLAVLPRAGMWMVEIKKFFAFILFGMCFYFLNKILPLNYTLFALSAFCAISGFYYFKSISKNDSTAWKHIKNLIGAVLIITSIIILFQAFQETLIPTEKISDNSWETDFDAAVKDGKLLNKKLFVDFTGDFCSICKAIEKNVLNNAQVKETIEKLFIKVKINASQDQKTYDLLQDRYKILGVPTMIIIDPKNMIELKRWGSELYKKPIDKFIEELNALK